MFGDPCKRRLRFEILPCTGVKVEALDDADLKWDGKAGVTDEILRLFLLLHDNEIDFNALDGAFPPKGSKSKQEGSQSPRAQAMLLAACLLT